MKKFLIIFLILITTGNTFAADYTFDEVSYEEISSNERMVNVPSGQVIHSRLNSDLTSQNNYRNEIITTQLMKDWIYFGKVIAPEGSLIRGRITSIQRASYANGNAKVNISFNEVVRPDNTVINIQAKPICVTVGDSRIKSGAKMVFEGVKQNIFSSRSISNVADNIATGAIAGGFVFLTTKGEEVNIPFGTEFRINIINNINVLSYEN